MVTNNEKSHDLGLILDQSGVPGRLHHVAFWVDSRDELLRAADILLNADIRDRVRPRPPRHGRAGLPLLPRARRRAHRDQHRRLPPLRARLGDQALASRPGLEHLLPQRRDARLDDGGRAAGRARRGREHGRRRTPGPRRASTEGGGHDDIRKVLIVGAGIGGLGAGAALAQRGVDVEIVEIKPEPNVYGVGINQPAQLAARAAGDRRARRGAAPSASSSTAGSSTTPTATSSSTSPRASAATASRRTTASPAATSTTS